MNAGEGGKLTTVHPPFPALRRRWSLEGTQQAHRYFARAIGSGSSAQPPVPHFFKLATAGLKKEPGMEFIVGLATVFLALLFVVAVLMGIAE